LGLALELHFQNPELPYELQPWQKASFDKLQTKESLWQFGELPVF